MNYREWSFAEGPAVLTSLDVDTKHTISVSEGIDQTTAGQLVFQSIGRPIAGKIRPFSGTLTVHGISYRIIGTYNGQNRTGHCHSINPAA